MRFRHILLIYTPLTAAPATEAIPSASEAPSTNQTHLSSLLCRNESTDNNVLPAFADPPSNGKYGRYNVTSVRMGYGGMHGQGGHVHSVVGWSGPSRPSGPVVVDSSFLF